MSRKRKTPDPRETYDFAPGLALPATAGVQAWGFMGRRGSGKTYAAGVLAEELLGVSGGPPVQVVVFDVVGTWWALRLLADGVTDSGLDVTVLGGEYADVPLAADTGAYIARLAVETGRSMVLDASKLRKNERKRLAADFFEELVELKHADRTPMHVFLEETHTMSPEMGGDPRLKGAVEDLVRIGRNHGLGVTMMSQRPQAISKAILNQADPLCVFQLVGKHERRAVADWTEEVGGAADAMVRQLHALTPGHGFLWAPGWLRAHKWEETLLPLRTRPKVTFDASETPTPGSIQATARPKPADAAGLVDALARLAESGKRADAATLRRRLADRDAELAEVRGVLSQVTLGEAEWCGSSMCGWCFSPPPPAAKPAAKKKPKRKAAPRRAKAKPRAVKRPGVSVDRFNRAMMAVEAANGEGSEGLTRAEVAEAAGLAPKGGAAKRLAKALLDSGAVVAGPDGRLTTVPK